MNTQTSRSLFRSCCLISLSLVACTPVLSCWATPSSASKGTAASPDTAGRAAVGDYVIGVSPFIPEAEVQSVKDALFQIVLAAVPSGSRVAVFDAYHLKQVTDLSLPAREAFDHAKIRAKYLGKKLNEIKQFLDAATADADTGEADLRIEVPQFLDLVASSRRSSASSLTVILIGGALYLDPRDGRFSMAHGRYPADDHLCVGRDESVYGVADRKAKLAGARVHYAYLVDPWVNSLHEPRVRRFWSMFIAEQGGQLISFAKDLSTVVKGIGDPVSPPPLRYDLICPAQLNLVMMAVPPDGEPSSGVLPRGGVPAKTDSDHGGKITSAREKGPKPTSPPVKRDGENNVPTGNGQHGPTCGAPDGSVPPPTYPIPQTTRPRVSPPQRGVRILSPQDGFIIRAGNVTEGPVRHPVDGEVYGFDRDAIDRLHLGVEIVIVTDQEYSQGFAEVQADGTWRLPTAYFGGSDHTVIAILRDGYGKGNEIHRQKIHVTVLH